MSILNSEGKLKLGIPKGSLEQATINLFAKSGWKIRTDSRNYFPHINDPDIAVSLARAQEIPRYVSDGVFDVGLSGKDWILENNADVVVVDDLIYSKVSSRKARWVLAVAGNSPYNKVEDLEGCRIATEIIGVSEKFFADAGVRVKVEYSWGATEAKVVEGLADAIIEVTETGSTIDAHGLRIIATVMETNTQLIANKKAWADPKKRKKIEQINLLLQGALRAESLVGLKMNVPAAKLENVVSILPSLNFPTVAPLQNAEWVAVEAVVDVSQVRDLIPQLTEGGAEGIIEYALNKVI
ncbi:MAG: ATP phosphoribosyltransferase [Desulfovibrionaceae bacterium]|nr:ATP phosphoribosyltransferase [Desulfovibrionaceae bacterium]